MALEKCIAQNASTSLQIWRQISLEHGKGNLDLVRLARSGWKVDGISGREVLFFKLCDGLFNLEGHPPAVWRQKGWTSFDVLRERR